MIKINRFIVVILLMLIFLTGCGLSVDLGIKNNVYLDDYNFGGYKESEAEDKIRKYAEKINIKVVEAKLNEATWELEEKEQAGRKVNIEKTLEKLLNSKEGDKVNPIVEELRPENTSEKLKDNVVMIGSYTTPLLDRQDARLNNIEIASEWIDYTIIKPGEEFSFNRILGKRTPSKGYELAPIIKKTEEGYKKGYGVGGGICQLSSTLYNAVEKSGLVVTERHNHTKEVGYVPKGRDATVSYGSVDFKFINSKKNPVMIRVYLDKSNLTVSVIENKN